MEITDVYTKKEYDCPKKCGSKVFYAKIKDDDDNYVTTDGLKANGKYGKDSNVLSGAVDVGATDNLHKCTAEDVIKKYHQLIHKEQPTPEPKKIPNVKWHEVPEQLTPLQSELYHGYHELNVIAYQLTKEQHPNLPEDDNTFGMIVHAKSLVLSNLIIAKAIKNSKPN